MGGGLPLCRGAVSVFYSPSRLGKKENGFKLVKERSRRYPAQTITDVDYADDIALQANSLAEAQDEQQVA